MATFAQAKTVTYNYVRDSFVAGDRALTRTAFGEGNLRGNELEIHSFSGGTTSSVDGSVLGGQDIDGGSTTLSATVEGVRVPMNEQERQGFLSDARTLEEGDLGEDNILAVRNGPWMKAVRHVEKLLLNSAMTDFESTLNGSSNATQTSGTASLTAAELDEAVIKLLARYGGEYQDLTIFLRQDAYRQVKSETDDVFHRPLETRNGTVAAYEGVVPVYISTSSVIQSTTSTTDNLGYVWHKDAVVGGIGGFDPVFPTQKNSITLTYDLAVDLGWAFAIENDDGVEVIHEG